MDHDDSEPKPTQDRANSRAVTLAQKQLVGFILVLALVNIAYRLVYATGFQRTAALYVGMPTMLAIGLALLPRSTSATAMLLRGSTLAMLIACVILPEGLLCLLFAVPLVALIAVIVGRRVDRARASEQPQGPALMVVALPLLLLSCEGVISSPFDTNDSATASLTVAATPDAVARALALPPNFDHELPVFLAVGFNRPPSATGSGIELGDHRTIVFNGGTHDDHPLRLFGLTGERSVDHQSEMHLRVIESGPGRVVFGIEDDMTMLSRWVDLQRAVVTWSALDSTTTEVSWTLEYDRRLFPTAYFAPLQRYGMDRAAEYLLETVVDDQLP